MASKTYKTSSGNKTVLAGSKAEKKYVSQGATLASASESRATKDASKARTSARSAADPLTVAENAGLKIPGRIEPGGMEQAVADLQKQTPVQLPGVPQAQTQPIPAPSTSTAPTTAQLGLGTGANVTTAPAQTPAQVGLAQAQASGPPPQSDGEAQGVLAKFTPPSPQRTQNDPGVDNFFQTNAPLQQSLQEVMDFVSPKSTTKELEQTMKMVLRDKQEAANLRLELMDIERVMDGSDQDIRDEVEKVGGFATESQVQALTVGRNKTLLKRASIIQNQLNYMKDIIDMDMTMLGFQKDLANQQFQERSFLIGYKERNDDRIYKATQDAAANQLKVLGADGLYKAAGGDPVKISRIEKTLGLPSGSLATASAKAEKEMQFKETKEALELDTMRSSLETDKLQRGLIAAQTSNLYSEIAKRNSEKALSTKEALKIQNQIQQANVVINKVDQIIPRVGKTTAGFLGGLSGKVPGTTAYNLGKEIDTIKANVGFQALQAMRDASPTGGALGQVAVQELNMLQSTVASLDQGQNPEQLKTNLRAVKEHFNNWSAAAQGTTPAAKLNTSSVGGGTNASGSTSATAADAKGDLRNYLK